jgi:flavin-dependent dehydrogenase
MKMKKKKIAIIGLGIAGIQLAYFFKREELFDIQVFAHNGSDDIRNGRIPSTQVHFEKLIRREKQYEMPNYGDVNLLKKVEIVINDQKIFKGNLDGRALSIDQRIYLPAMIDGLKKSGVAISKERLSKNDIHRLTEEFDLIIDCTGKIGPLFDFEISNDIKTPERPLRVCSAGFFKGIKPEENNKLGFHIVPEKGELFEMQIATQHGLYTSILLEAVPGSDLDKVKGDRGPEDFTLKIKEVLKEYFPSIFNRLSENEFSLVDEKAYTRMAIRPQIRVPFLIVNDKLVLGCGDSVFLNDPITGQGANTASFCAEHLYQTLKDNIETKWDLSVGQDYWQRIKDYVLDVSEWTNAMMGPLSESFVEFIGKASQNQMIADQFVNMFHNPREAHKVFFSIPSSLK